MIFSHCYGLANCSYSALRHPPVDNVSLERAIVSELFYPRNSSDYPTSDGFIHLLFSVVAVTHNCWFLKFNSALHFSLRPSKLEPVSHDSIVRERFFVTVTSMLPKEIELPMCSE